MPVAGDINGHQDIFLPEGFDEESIRFGDLCFFKGFLVGELTAKLLTGLGDAQFQAACPGRAIRIIIIQCLLLFP